jgi:hypothetical protein
MTAIDFLKSKDINPSWFLADGQKSLSELLDEYAYQRESDPTPELAFNNGCEFMRKSIIESLKYIRSQVENPDIRQSLTSIITTLPLYPNPPFHAVYPIIQSRGIDFAIKIIRDTINS